jgi:hypothetical protein
MAYLNRRNLTEQRNQDIQSILQYQQGGMGGPFPQMQTPMGQQHALQMMDPLRQAQLQAEKARTAYWSRDRATTGTPSPIQKMITEGIITPEEGKDLALKTIKGELTEKDIISIMHTIQSAIGETYDALGTELKGPEMAKNRLYYVQQLESYQKRLDKLRGQGEARKILGDAGINVPEPTTGITPAEPGFPGMNQPAPLPAEEFSEPGVPPSRQQGIPTGNVKSPYLGAVKEYLGSPMQNARKAYFPTGTMVDRPMPSQRGPQPPALPPKPIAFNPNRKPHPKQTLKMPPAPANLEQRPSWDKLQKIWWSLPSDLQHEIWLTHKKGVSWDKIYNSDELENYRR